MSALWHFAQLAPDQHAQVIRRLASCGHDEHRIASLTNLSLDLIGRVLAEQARGAAS